MLVDALEADGLSVWWDAHVGSGDDWRDVIQKELDEAKCVVVAWSKRSVGSEGKFVRDEASRAERKHVYVPIRIDKVEPPLGFGETQALLFSGWTGNRSDPRYQSLLETIRALISGRPRPASVHATGPVIDRRMALVGGSAIVVAAVGGGWFAFRPRSAAALNRIAVLSFANLSGDPAQAYFSDGISEELRSSLSRIGLQVIGRASSDAVKDLDTKTAAAKLGVANILSGSVRRSPSTIRIDVELLSGSDGVERWAQSYDRAPGDTIKIQTDIAENVARSLSVALGSALSVGGTSIAAAQDLFLKAIHEPGGHNLPVIEHKLALVDAALSLDPNYAEAYAQKAFLLSVKAGIAPTAEAANRGQAEALATANHAIAIAPKLAAAYDARAFIYRLRLQNGAALADAKQAAALSGQNSHSLTIYATQLAHNGQVEESLRLNAKAISLDPLNPGPYADRAAILYGARRYAEAEESARRGLALAPQANWARGTLGDILLAQGKTAEAEAEYSKLDQFDASRMVGEAVIAARVGQRSKALRTLEYLSSDAAQYQYAQIYAQLGMTEDAFRSLELAWKMRDPGLVSIRNDPFLDPLRKDPRMAALEQRLGLS